MKCQNCGAEVTGRFCEFCGTRVSKEMLQEQERLNKSGCAKCGSTNISFRRENQGEIRGKNHKSVVHRTVGVCKDCGHTWYADTPNYQPPKKRKTWLWVLGWICIFPVPLTILLLRKKQMNPVVKYGIIALAWILYLVIGISGNSDNSASGAVVKNEEATSPTSIIIQGDIAETIDDNSVTENESSVAQNGNNRDETLKGRGYSDTGRSEPQYIGIIGYAADNTFSGTHENDKFSETPWTVPVYERDKQFFVECGRINHKTEVLVLNQELKHTGYGNYEGYLTVEDTQTGEQYLLNVSNFITKPYWTYSPLEAVRVGNFVAEYHQVSDYWPVNKSNEKVELDEGTVVLAIRATGLYGKGGPDDDTNQIEAVVFKEWKYGYGGVSVFFNVDDLTIVY